MFGNQHTARALAILVIAASAATMHECRASIVATGWDLSQSQTITVDGFQFQGVALGSYDFGGAIGVQNTGANDTIVQRLQTATGNSPQTVNTQMVAFQMTSGVPISFLGGPTDYYFLTLQSARGGTTSTGSYLIAFGPDGASHGGTYNSTVSLYFDVRKGSLNGSIVASGDTTITNTGNTIWSNVAPAGTTLINGANFHLYGANSDQDFFATAVPEPGSGTLAAIVGLGVAAVRWRQSRARRHDRV